MTEIGPWPRIENQDSWREDQTCTFCGGLDPDYLLDCIDAGIAELTPTDKSYKVYAQVEGKFYKVYFQHFDISQQDEFLHFYNEKPRKFKIGYPGYLYVEPFFAGVNNV